MAGRRTEAPSIGTCNTGLRNSSKWVETNENFCFQNKVDNLVEFPIHSGNYIILSFGHVVKPVLIDTGATISMVSVQLLKLIDPMLLRKIKKGVMHTARLVTGDLIEIKGEITLNLSFHKQNIVKTFQVIDKMTYWAILGIDFF